MNHFTLCLVYKNKVVSIKIFYAKHSDQASPGFANVRKPQTVIPLVKHNITTYFRLKKVILGDVIHFVY